MRQFNTLIYYETKKVIMRKNTWITLGILVAFSVFLAVGMGFGSVYVDGELLETHAERNATDRKNGIALSGRKLDDVLLGEMQAAYAKVADEPGVNYMLTDKYRKEVRPYSPVRDMLLWMMYDAEINPLTATEEELYRERKKLIEEKWDNYKLSDSEKKYWQKKENEVIWPFTYQYAEGFNYLCGMTGIYQVCLFVSLLIAVCMSSVFTEEHGKKVDQLILCSRLGRGQIYFAKILTGAVFSSLVAVLFWGIKMAGDFAALGSEGFSAGVQLFIGTYSYPLTIGQVFLIMTGILLISSVLTGIFTMVLSELTGSNVAAMTAVVVIQFLARLLPVPSALQFISKLWNLMPLNILKLDEGFSDMRLFSLFGMKFTSWQVAPILYIVLGVLLVLIGKRKYCRYQVQGR